MLCATRWPGKGTVRRKQTPSLPVRWASSQQPWRRAARMQQHAGKTYGSCEHTQVVQVSSKFSINRLTAPVAWRMTADAGHESTAPAASQGHHAAHRIAAKVTITAASAMLAEAATFPIDLTKTRMQMAAQSGAPRLGAIATAAGIVSAQGVPGLFRGVSPAVLRHVAYSPTRILAYEALRDTADEGLVAKMTAGATAGALGQLGAVPADLVKVRMQADALAAVPRYRGVAHALSTVLREDGVGGLWRGTLPAVQRAALVNLGELATYDVAKRAAVRACDGVDGPMAHALAALASGFVATAVSCPADVLKTRLMNQSATGPRQYSGMLDCLSKSVAAEGWTVLWRGFFPTWARLGPWQMVFWLSYEHLRASSGIQGF